MTVVAESVDSLAIERVAHLIALSPTFQNGRDWQTTHDNSVFYGSKTTVDGEQRPTRPYAVVDFGDDARWSKIAGGGFNVMRPSGSVWFAIEYDWPPAFYEDELMARHEAFNFLGNVARDVAALSGVDVSPDLGKEFTDESGDFNFHSLRYARSQVDPDDYAKEDWFFRIGGFIEWGDIAS